MVVAWAMASTASLAYSFFDIYEDFYELCRASNEIFAVHTFRHICRCRCCYYCFPLNCDDHTKNKFVLSSGTIFLAVLLLLLLLLLLLYNTPIRFRSRISFIKINSVRLRLEQKWKTAARGSLIKSDGAHHRVSEHPCNSSSNRGCLEAICNRERKRLLWTTETTCTMGLLYIWDYSATCNMSPSLSLFACDITFYTYGHHGWWRTSINYY